MTVILRFIGVMNAAVWLGATFFFFVAAGPAFHSEAMQQILGPRNYPYFSGALEEILLRRCFYLQCACGLVALLHLLGRRLYLGRSGRPRPTATLVVGLLGLALLSGVALQPRLKQLHLTRYAQNATPVQRVSAARSFGIWHVVSLCLDVVMIGGLVIYVWQVATPNYPSRFVSSVKFRD